MPQKPDLEKREVWRKRLRNFEWGNGTIVEFCRGLRVCHRALQNQPLRGGFSSRGLGDVDIPHAAMSETFSNRWKFRVMSEARSLACALGIAAMVWSMAARNSANVGWYRP